MYGFYLFKMLRYVLLLSICPILVNVPCELEKNVCSVVAGMKLSIDVNYIQLIDFVVEFSCVISDFLLAGSIHFCRRGVEVYNYDSGFIYSFLQFYQFSPNTLFTVCF